VYCSSCGVAVPHGLSYCNRCGAELSAPKRDRVTKSAEASPESLIEAMVFVFIIGLAAIIGLIAVMKHFGLNEGLINGFSALTFLVMLALESVFIWLLLARKRSAKEANNTARLMQQGPEEVGTANARALPQGRSSVTERTTHTFEPIYTEQGRPRE
jgi:hypothetical protein